ncbi:hypothetical protein ACQEVI_00680 [Promicromonospora sp. CA-289599]|uniref:hypothetical protein n=1 Tax=Promicromonospora sp. CA-289599 TaxID=3240014 RepID=UPI003D8D9026
MTARTLPGLEHFPGVTVAEADGVPVLLAPRGGNVGGGIVFRVGSAHETLATSGITHLIEHLALRGQVLSEAHLNGQTHTDVTLFHVAGSATDVITYLNDVCAALRELPVERTETEKDILRAEADGKSRGFGAGLRINRHGARGFGLAGYGERGLDRITTDEVLDWAATWFTRENAVAWVTSDTLPDGLDLRLPAGRRMPPPVLTDVLQDSPAYLTGLRDGVALDAVVPRGDAAWLTSRVIRELLHRDLRARADIASSVDVDYDPLDADHARVSVAVQAAEGRQDAVAGGVADALSSLRFHVADDDLAAARAGVLEELAEMSSVPSAELLPSLAYRMVAGRPLDGPEQIRATVERVTADDVRASARELWTGALWYGSAGLDWAGIDPVPTWSPEHIEGRVFRRSGAPDVSLVLGADGVAFVTPEGSHTVRFADCVLLESVPDGARALTGADGFRVVVEPTLYEGLTGADVAEHVDPRVPDGVVVRLPAREPGDIPVAEAEKADGDSARRAAVRAGRLRAVATTVGLVIALWVGGVALVEGVWWLLTQALGREPGGALLPLVILIWLTVSLVRKRHGRNAR